MMMFQKQVVSWKTILIVSIVYGYTTMAYMPLGWLGQQHGRLQLTDYLPSSKLSATGRIRLSGAGDSEAIVNRREVLVKTSFLLPLIIACPLLVTLPSIADAAYIDPNIDMPTITKRVYLDVLLPGNDNPSRLVIGLFGDNLPRVVDNFVKLCDGISFNNDATVWSYAGSTFYRILSDMSVQGGAVGDSSGKTGKSAFDGGVPFEPDNYNIRHSKEGLISMVRNQNGAVDSRFFINTKTDAGWADDRYAAFGIVEEGMDIIHEMEKVKVQRPQNSPVDPVKIVASGVLPR